MPLRKAGSVTSTIPALCGSITGKPNPFGVAIHQAGYTALGLDFKYVSIGTDDLASVVAAFRALRFRGFGISMPFKQQIIPLLHEVSEEVRAIGACNTVVATDDRLRGENTDWSGALDALKEAGALNGSTAVIIGSGGVARAIAFGLKRSGYRVSISARNAEAARTIAQDLSVEVGDFDADLVVNATPDASLNGPVQLDRYPRANALLDVIGHVKSTPLTEEAARRGFRVAPGWRMRLHQACRQFELYTKHPAPMQIMSDALEQALT